MKPHPARALTTPAAPVGGDPAARDIVFLAAAVRGAEYWT